MAASWYLAPSLVQLRSEINQRWPNRNKASDGSIGDPRHQAAGSGSDHNPNARRSVNAIDVTRSGADIGAIMAAAKQDRRTNYLIYNRVIYSARVGFAPRAYYGANPHDKHVHISIWQSPVHERDRSPWGIVKPGLPSTGATGTQKPSVPATTKENTLSAAEVAEIKAEVWKAAKALQTQGFNRDVRNDTATQTAKLIANNGFDRPVLEKIGEAAARQSYAKVSGAIAANQALLQEVKAAGGLTDEMLARVDQRAQIAAEKGSREGVKAGASEIAAELAVAVREVLGDVVFDLGRDLDKDALSEITDQVVAEITARLNPEGGKA